MFPPYSTEAQQQAVALPETETESQDAPVPQVELGRAPQAKTKACLRGKEASESEVITFRGSPPPGPHSKWIGQQDETEIPNGGRLLEAPSIRIPRRTLGGRRRPETSTNHFQTEQRERLVKQEHLALSAPRRTGKSCSRVGQVLLLAQDERSYQTDCHVVSRLSGQ